MIKYSQVINLIDRCREQMYKSNPFFQTITDEKLSFEQRMLFMPYMLFFSCGGPDVITLLMRSEKENQNLSFLEKKVNAFINEDNFHYNFYLKDLEALGYGFKKFGSVAGVVRHIYSQESIAVRKLVYSLGYYCRQHLDPLVRLTLCELIEAGLYDLFVTIYKKIIKHHNSPYADLHYFGDTHVRLEMNHTVTSWFSGADSDVASIEVSDHLNAYLTQVVEDIMSGFDSMYSAFNEIILHGENIFPEKFNITNLPPIDQVTNHKYQ